MVMAKGMGMALPTASSWPNTLPGMPMARLGMKQFEHDKTKEIKTPGRGRAFASRPPDLDRQVEGDSNVSFDVMSRWPACRFD